MTVTALPDLNVLAAEELRALIVAQHRELITKNEQLLSREREIEHLKLLLVKLHRLQFGRKSEKLARQIEHLELRLEELESNRSEEAIPSESSSVTAQRETREKPARRTLPDHLPRQTRTHVPKETVCREQRANLSGLPGMRPLRGRHGLCPLLLGGDASDASCSRIECWFTAFSARKPRYHGAESYHCSSAPRQ
jgi:hypothetical protein